MNSNAVILEIRAATGGEEAKIWAQDLLRMYTRYALKKGWKMEVLDDGVLRIRGENVFTLLKHEAGVHRVQRIPETERRGRIHTSTASVAVLPEISQQQISIRPEDLDWQFTRAGGHGGQNVNKVNTAVRLWHKSSGLVISVRQERSQQQNRAIALQLLRNKLWQLEEERRLGQLGQTRKAAVGTGERAEKIRTYNFPQNRVTDHRLNKSWHNLDSILAGNLTPIIHSLQKSPSL